jgi:sulfur-oxidizing protein SoxX
MNAKWIVLPVVVAALAGCATDSSPPDPQAVQARFQQLLLTDFQGRGIATIDRIRQDDVQRLCTDPAAWDGPAHEAARKRVEEANMATIRWPSDGRFLGDWQQGEIIAQSGRGMTWTDDARTVNGGNCYNCHQIDRREASFGTLGPSLWNYGRIRGVTDLNSPAAEAMIRYTWGRIWNSRAYNACANMPRFGHKAILTEEQIRHVMALLLDPASPVNQPQ